MIVSSRVKVQPSFYLVGVGENDIDAEVFLVEYFNLKQQVGLEKKQLLSTKFSGQLQLSVLVCHIYVPFYCFVESSFESATCNYPLVKRFFFLYIKQLDVLAILVLILVHFLNLFCIQ